MKPGIIDRFVAFAAALFLIGGALFGAAIAETQTPAPQPAVASQGDFPPNEGFLGEITVLMLQPGQKIDRYGGTPVSRFFSPQGTPLEARSLPPETAKQILRTFEVVKEFEVNAGTVAPYYGQPGLGTQYRASLPLGELLDQGYVLEILP